MAERKRAIQFKLWVDENEKKLIEEKMKILGTRNFGAYARKMLIDGYIIRVDYSEQRKLAAEVPTPLLWRKKALFSISTLSLYLSPRKRGVILLKYGRTPAIIAEALLF